MSLRRKIALIATLMLPVIVIFVMVALWVVLPAGTVQDNLGALVFVIVAATAAGLAAGVALIYRLIIWPVRQLSRELRDGEATVPIHVSRHGKDEIARLATTVNQAFERLYAAQQDLEMNQQHLRTLVTHAPVILFSLDKRGVFTLMEGSGLGAMGFTPGQYVGKSIFDVFKDNTFLLDDVRRGLDGASVRNLINIGDQAFDVYYAPFSREGAVDGLVCVAVNATERVQTEEALRMAKEEAEKASQSKSTFLANMSHELRTPLNAIIGFVSIMLMSNKLNDKDLYRAERIRANGERLLAIIDEVLDLSRIEAGRMTLVPNQINVRAVIDDVEARMSARAHRHRQRRLYQSPDEPHQQRHQIHRRRPRPHRPEPGRIYADHPGDGYGHRHPAAPARRHLRALPSGR
jgi:signal transduction histidine kinase